MTTGRLVRRTGGLLMLLLLAIGACSDRGQTVERHRENARVFFDGGQYAKARVEINNVLRLGERAASDYLLAGRIQKETGNYRQAFAFFEQAQAADPDDVEALVELAYFYTLAKEREKATDLITRALSIDNNSADAHAIHGTLLVLDDAQDDAELALERALTLEQDNALALPALAGLWVTDDRIEEATLLVTEAYARSPRREDIVLLLARLQAGQQRYVEAAELLHQLYEQRPEDATLVADVARLLQLAGEEENAEKTLRAPIDAGIRGIEFRRALLAYLLSQNRFDEALRAIDQDIAASPGDGDLYLMRAMVFTRMDMFEQAREQYHDILNSFAGLRIQTEATIGQAQLLQNQGDDRAAIAVLDNLLQEHSTSRDALVLRAGFHNESKDFVSAAADLRAALAVNPEDLAARSDLAYTLIRAGEWQFAAAQFRIIIEQSPNDVQPRVSLAKLLMEQQDYAGARVVVAGALDINEKEANALALAYAIEGQAGNRETALKFARLMSEYHPDNSLGHYYVAESLFALGEESTAVDALQRALSIDPQAAEPLSRLVAYQINQGQSQAALRRLNQVLDRFPDHALAYYLRGQIFLGSRQLTEATQDFAAALNHNASMTEAYRGLAATFLRQGEPTAAVQILERGLAAIEPLQAERISTDLVLVHMREGRYSEAVAECERYLQQQPDSLLTINNLAMLLIEQAPYENSLARARILVDALADSRVAEYVDTYAQVLMQTDETETALQALLNHESRTQPSGLTSFRRGVLLDSMSRHDEARRAYAAAIELAPNANFAKAALAALQ